MIHTHIGAASKPKTGSSSAALWQALSGSRLHQKHFKNLKVASDRDRDYVTSTVVLAWSGFTSQQPAG